MLRKGHHPVVVLPEHIAALYAPPTFPAVFRSHILLQSDAGVRPVQTAGVNGITAHVGLKCLVIAGYRIGAGALAVCCRKAVCTECDIPAHMDAASLCFAKQLTQLSVAQLDMLLQILC